MKKIFLALIVFSFACKKNSTSVQPSYTVIGIDANVYTFSVPESGQGIIGSSLSTTNSPSNSFDMHLSSPTDSENNIALFTPSLNIDSQTFDSTSQYTKQFSIAVNGTYYGAQSLTINSFHATLSQHSWSNIPDNAIGSGTFDISFQALIDSGGKLTTINKIVNVKGNFKNIFGVQ